MQIIHGPMEVELRKFDENIFSSCVTDPPYGLSFMGKKWDVQVPPVEHWVEVFRVLKPGAHLIAFGGTRTYHRLVCAIEDAGFEIRDMMAWIHAQGFPKSHNRRDLGLGSALKPAIEPIVLARKPLEGTLDQNYAKYGTGYLNIEKCRIPGEPWTFGTQTDISGGGFGSKRPSDGDILAKNVVGGETGRWPANIMHDGSEEVLSVFPDSKGQLGKAKNGGKKKGQVFGDYQENVTYNPEPRTDSGSAARFFFCAKTSRKDRNEGCESMEKRPLLWSSGTQNPGSFQAEGTDKSSQNNHPTVKPTELMRYYVRLVTPPNGNVLDPYCGSGSTLKAAALEGHDGVGIDMDAHSVEIANARVNFVEKQTA